MRSASSEINIANARSRTLVLRDSPRPVGKSLSDRLLGIPHRLPARLKSFANAVAQPGVLLVLGLIAISFSVMLIYYYSKFASEIDARLQGSLDNSVGILTAPIKVAVGDRLPINDLIDYLRRAGYQQRSEAVDENLAGSFEVDGNALLVFPGDTSIQAGLAPVAIQVDKNERVVSLTSPTTGERLSSASVEGELLASVRDGERRKKIRIQFSDIPENLRNAIVAAEDRRFFSHKGIDWHGIMRALKTDISQGEFAQGGSTLTQQIIKNDFLTPDRTLSRKLKEALMAIILESRLTKEQIFAFYCNDVYLGQSGTYAVNGFAQAAQVYFDKDLNDLTLSESAFLAGLTCAPNRYSPHRDLARAVERRNTVLDAMAETEAITREGAERAKAEPLEIKKHEIEDDDGVSYFIDYVQRFADSRLGAGRVSSQQQITTTIDPRLQHAAYTAVKRQTAQLDKLYARSARKNDQSRPVQAALVALDAHTGEVLAMVGGRSYDESQLNRATDSKRQPGSAFKPFVYATALSSRAFTAASTLSDTPQSFSYDGGRSQYKPSDYHGGFTNRDVTLREALTRSLNVPAVQLAMRAGLSNVATVAERSGLDRPRAYPSMALGTSEVTPLQLAGAYTAFANYGTALQPIPVKSISSRDKTHAAQQVRASGANVFSPQVAYLMTNLLQGVVDHGTASRIRAMGLKGAIAGKTGTSSDGWFVGYTPNVICAVWVGFDDNRDLRMKASDTALPMWADFMTQALELRPDLGGDSFNKPGGIVTVVIDPTTGCLAGPESASRIQEIFIAGTEPTSNCSQMAEDSTQLPEIEDESPVDSVSDKEKDTEGEETVSVEVCSLTGLLASPDCPETEKRTFRAGEEPHTTCRADFHREPENLRNRLNVFPHPPGSLL
jgi:penicillin-binding protein 1B